MDIYCQNKNGRLLKVNDLWPWWIDLSTKITRKAVKDL